MKKRFRIALLSAAAVLLIVLICVIGTHLYRQAYRYSGTIVSWSPENHPYEIHDLSSGTSERLSAETYSKKYRDTGYALDCSDGSMTVAVWTNGTQLLRFSSDLYTESAPVLLGDCVYFAAAETAEIGAAYYLWEYDDGQIRKCMETPVHSDSPVVFSASQLLLSTSAEDQIVVYDVAAGTTDYLTDGLRPCWAEQENSIYFIDPTSWELCRYRLDTQTIEQTKIPCADFCHLAYSHTNRGILLQTVNGTSYTYSIYEIDTGRHVVFTLPFRLLMGWWRITHLNDAASVVWIG